MADVGISPCGALALAALQQSYPPDPNPCHSPQPPHIAPQRRGSQLALAITLTRSGSPNIGYAPAYACTTIMCQVGKADGWTGAAVHFDQLGDFLYSLPGRSY